MKNKKEPLRTKLKKWGENPYNKIFLAILIIATLIRLYHFSIAGSQPLWWDESDYLAYAKNLAGLGGDWIVTAQHNSLFPYVIAGLFSIGFNELATKFLIEVLPSILLVILTYITCLKMYSDKRIALASSFLMATFWVVLFNSMRFHLGVPGLFTGLLATYIFFTGYERKEKIFGKIDPKWTIPLSVALVILTYAIRRGYFLFGAFFLIYMLTTGDIRELVKDKYNWIGLGIAIGLLLLLESTIFSVSIGEVGGTYFHPENPITLLPLDVFKSYFVTGTNILGSILYYTFILGAILILATITMSLGLIKKTRRKETLSDVFVAISILITLLNFIFILRTPNIFGEPRWYLPLALPAFICISKGTIFLADKVKKYHKHAMIMVMILLLGIGGHSQFTHADTIIKERATSFEGIRSAGTYIAGISEKEDIVISQPVPQTIYYSGNRVLQPEMVVGIKGNGYTQEEFLEALQNHPERNNIKYLLISFSEPGYPTWMRNHVGNQNGQLIGWQIPFLDTDVNFQTQQQNIKQTKTFEKQGITFTLSQITQDVFIYKISYEEQ